VALSDFSGGQYVAYSKIGAASAEGSKPLAELSPEQLRTYLEVPASISPSVRKLALEITKDRVLPLAKVAAVTEWLRRTHKYTTDLKRNPDIVDPLEDFLFHEEAGHCEYFATATAMLLRIAGIPTRYINGFLGGDSTWQELGLDLRTYRRLRPDGRQKLAFWLLGDFVTGGVAPYFDLPSTGGDLSGRMARGYTEGRFRGPQLMYGEIEYRNTLVPSGLVGFVAFLNTTTVGGDVTGEKLFQSFEPATGLGLRLLLNKHSKTNLCVDYGWGVQQSHGLYLALQEAF